MSNHDVDKRVKDVRRAAFVEAIAACRGVRDAMAPQHRATERGMVADRCAEEIHELMNPGRAK